MQEDKTEIICSPSSNNVASGSRIPVETLLSSDLCSRCASVDFVSLFNDEELYMQSMFSYGGLVILELGDTCAAFLKASLCPLCHLFVMVANCESEFTKVFGRRCFHTRVARMAVQYNCLSCAKQSLEWNPDFSVYGSCSPHSGHPNSQNL